MNIETVISGAKLGTDMITSVNTIFLFKLVIQNLSTILVGIKIFPGFLSFLQTRKMQISKILDILELSK